MKALSVTARLKDFLTSLVSSGLKSYKLYLSVAEIQTRKSLDVYALIKTVV